MGVPHVVGSRVQSAAMSVVRAIELFATLSGGLGTPVAIWLGLRGWQREAERTRLDEQIQRRHQPSRVVVRTEPALWPRVDGRGEYLTRVATVVNASDAPVFDVSLFWHENEDLTDCAASRVALMPGESWQQAMPMSLQHNADCDQVFASIWFFDADGQGWRRGPRGSLERIRDYLAIC